MTKEQLIVKQAMEIERLREKLVVRDEALQHVYNVLHCIGAPLNDNKSGLSPQQLQIFHRLAEIIDL